MSYALKKRSVDKDFIDLSVSFLSLFYKIYSFGLFCNETVGLYCFLIRLAVFG